MMLTDVRSRLKDANAKNLPLHAPGFGCDGSISAISSAHGITMSISGRSRCYFVAFGCGPYSLLLPTCVVLLSSVDHARKLGSAFLAVSRGSAAPNEMTIQAGMETINAF